MVVRLAVKIQVCLSSCFHTESDSTAFLFFHGESGEHKLRLESLPAGYVVAAYRLGKDVHRGASY
jgi:hypothetical protein